MLVRHWMTEQIELARPEENVAVIAARLRDCGIRQLPVVTGGRLVGIITDRDVRAVREPTAKVEEVMSKPVVTVPSDTRVEDAAEMLRQAKIGALPVVDRGELVGIVSESDLLDALVELCHIFEPTTLIEVECDEGGVAVQRLRTLLERHGASVRWLSAAAGENGRQVLMLRVDTPIGNVPERALEEAGYRVLSVVIGAGERRRRRAGARVD